MTVRPDTARLERIVGVVLRLGVAASTVFLAAGLVMSFLDGAAGAARFLLNTGVIVLLATPVARVVVSMVEYAFERDWIFVGLTLTVLLELLAGGVAAIYGRKL
jgi:uncharacterized membrane protein